MKKYILIFCLVSLAFAEIKHVYKYKVHKVNFENSKKTVKEKPEFDGPFPCFLVSVHYTDVELQETGLQCYLYFKDTRGIAAMHLVKHSAIKLLKSDLEPDKTHSLLEQLKKFYKNMICLAVEFDAHFMHEQDVLIQNYTPWIELWDDIEEANTADEMVSCLENTFADAWKDFVENNKGVEYYFDTLGVITDPRPKRFTIPYDARVDFSNEVHPYVYDMSRTITDVKHGSRFRHVFVVNGFDLEKFLDGYLKAGDKAKSN